MIDGDTLEVETESGTRLVDLWGIDAPELGQDWGNEAQQFVAELAQGHLVEIEARGTIGERFFATVKIDEADLAPIVIRNGFAWLPEGGETNDAYAVELFMARAEKVGIWAGTSQIHPARWRETANALPTPVPTPTPGPPKLSDIAGSVEISDETGHTISSESAPSRRTRQKETEKFKSRIRSISYEASKVKSDREYLLENCHLKDNQPLPEDAKPGSYWSERDQKWVSDTTDRPKTRCDEVHARYVERLKKVRHDMEVAVIEAQRFGVAPSVVNSTLKANGLDDL